MSSLLKQKSLLTWWLTALCCNVAACHKIYRQQAIPNRLLFNYKVNLLSDPNALPQHAANVQNLISSYPGMEVEFLDNNGCALVLERAHSKSLADAFRGETFGPYKSDLCRLAQVYEKGGYYLDNDLEYISDFRNLVPADASFVTVAHPGADIFQALIGAAPRHPLIKQTLDMMHVAYQDPRLLKQLRGNVVLGAVNATLLRSQWFGPEAIASEWRKFAQQPVMDGILHHPHQPAGFQTSYMFLESDNTNLFNKISRRANPGCCCNHVVGDAHANQAAFHSRFVGASGFCSAR